MISSSAHPQDLEGEDGELYMVLLLPAPSQEPSACQQPISTNPEDHRDLVAGEEHKIKDSV